MIIYQKEIILTWSIICCFIKVKNPKNIYIQNNLENSLEIENIVWEEILDD